MIHTTNSRRDYWLIMLLFCISGNQAFTAPDRKEIILIAVFIILSIYVIAKGLHTVNKRFALIVIIFLALFIFQGIDFFFFPIETIIGFYVRLTIAFLIVYLVTDYSSVYCKVLYHISIISLFFYVIDQISLSIGFPFRSITQPLQDLVAVDNLYTEITRVNIGIYNFQEGVHINRNSAFFLEPGMFAGYLIIGIALLSISREKITNYWRLLIIFILALLSTMSTMGYVLLPLALMFHIKIDLSDKKKTLLQLSLLISMSICFLIIAVQLSRLPFLTDKIIMLWDTAANKGQNWELSRFGNFIFDWEYIKLRPLTGWGLHESTRYKLNPEIKLLIMGNGLSDFIAKFGFIGLLTVVLNILKGSFRLWESRWKSASFVMLFLLVLFGEPYLNYAAGLSLMFLGTSYTRNQKVNSLMHS